MEVRPIDANALLKNKVSNAYISRFEIESAPTLDYEPVVHAHWNANKANVKAMQEFHKKGIGLSMSEKSIYWTCS